VCISQYDTTTVSWKPKAMKEKCDKGLRCPMYSSCWPTPGVSQRGLRALSVTNNIQSFYVFHVRALYYTKTLITNKCTKRVVSSIVTHSYMFRPCWVIFRENFFVIVTLRLHFTVEWGCAVDCVLEAWTVCGPGLHCTAGPDRREFTPPKRTQYTANSTFSLNYKVQP
jgi:hypothetical protein